MNMTSTNTFVVLILEADGDDGFLVVWIIVRLMQCSSFDLCLFHLWILLLVSTVLATLFT